MHRHQAGYYQALNQSTAQTDSAAFIAFMLQRIKEALADTAGSPHDAPQVTPQVVKLLQVLTYAMSREQLQRQLGLADRKSFHQAYLQPALEQGLIEMTLPDKPQSKLQQYRITSIGKAVLHRVKQQE